MFNERPVVEEKVFEQVDLASVPVKVTAAEVTDLQNDEAEYAIVADGQDQESTTSPLPPLPPI